MGKFATWLKSGLPEQKYNAMFDGAFLSGYNLTHKGHGVYQKIPTKGLSATVQDGANIGTFISGKRVVAGAILLGPLGAGIGALMRKNHNQVHVVIERDDQVVGTLSTSAKNAQKARKFSDALNASASDPDNK